MAYDGDRTRLINLTRWRLVRTSCQGRRRTYVRMYLECWDVFRLFKPNTRMTWLFSSQTAIIYTSWLICASQYSPPLHRAASERRWPGAREREIHSHPLQDRRSSIYIDRTSELLTQSRKRQKSLSHPRRTLVSVCRQILALRIYPRGGAATPIIREQHDENRE